MSQETAMWENYGWGHQEHHHQQQEQEQEPKCTNVPISAQYGDVSEGNTTDPNISENQPTNAENLTESNDKSDDIDKSASKQESTPTHHNNEEKLVHEYISPDSKNTTPPPEEEYAPPWVKENRMWTQKEAEDFVKKVEKLGRESMNEKPE